MNSETTNTKHSLPVLQTLDNVTPGESVEVCELSKCDECLCKKLSAMGIVSGCIIKVLGRAPFGDPISISALGYKLSLRLSEAKSVITKEKQ